MNFRPGAELESQPGIELTPLIDVVFLLLIFFMVSSTFREEAELSVDLPRATTGEVLVESTPLEVVVSAAGDYFVNGRLIGKVDATALAEALTEAAAGHEQEQADPPRVVVSADRLASHESVIRVMEAARRAGFMRLGFTTAKE